MVAIWLPCQLSREIHSTRRVSSDDVSLTVADEFLEPHGHYAHEWRKLRSHDQLTAFGGNDLVHHYFRDVLGVIERFAKLGIERDSQSRLGPHGIHDRGFDLGAIVSMLELLGKSLMESGQSSFGRHVIGRISHSQECCHACGSHYVPFSSGNHVGKEFLHRIPVTSQIERNKGLQ